MKLLLLLVASLASISSIRGASEPPTSPDAWRRLSAECQNLHFRLLTILRDGQPNPEQLKPDIARISELLDHLVESKQLVRKEVSIKFPEGEAESKSIEGFLESIQPIADKYGVFVAREMCDFGARLRLMAVAPKQRLKLTLRLPKEELREFLEANRHLGVLEDE